MARISSSLADPSSDAASVLRRVGFWLLFFATPVAALFARRAIVILAPVGIVLLALAAALDGGSKVSAGRLRHLLTSLGGLAGLLMLLWAALSLVWTPFVGQASERLVNVTGLLLMAVVGYLAMPDRMRSANLYILPVGVALGAVAAIVMGLRDAPIADEDGQNLERGLIVLVIVLWPAVTWLHSRGRNIEAVILAVSVALASILAPGPLPIQGLAAGAIVFALTAFAPFLAPWGLALAMAGLLLLAPAIPFVMRPLMMNWLGPDAPTTAGLAVWQSVVASEPLRLITGHGLETALRGRISGLLDPHAPGTFLFEIWYELGLVGAAAGAAVLFASVTGASGDRPLLTPGIMAAFATAFTFGCLGIGTAQAWWFTALLILVLIFVAVERGQFRTTRPKAVLRRGR